MSWEVLHGDCIEVMRGMDDNSVDVVVTDPPYGVGLKYKDFDDTRIAIREMAKEWVPEAIRISKGPVAFTPGAGNQWLYPEPTWSLGWAMKAGSGRSKWGFQCYHPILVYGKCPYLSNRLGGRHDTYFPNGRVKASVEKTVHPCAKPECVMDWIIDRVDPYKTAKVLDPFCGSGTTGVSCVKSGRSFIGIEMSRDYVDISRQRIGAAEQVGVA